MHDQVALLNAGEAHRGQHKQTTRRTASFVPDNGKCPNAKHMAIGDTKVKEENPTYKVQKFNNPREIRINSSKNFD